MYTFALFVHFLLMLVHRMSLVEYMQHSIVSRIWCTCSQFSVQENKRHGLAENIASSRLGHQSCEISKQHDQRDTDGSNTSDVWLELCHQFQRHWLILEGLQNDAIPIV